MQQYREGQRLQGSDGRVYVVRNGVPVFDAPSPAFGPAIGNDPRIPLTMQGQALQNTKNAQDIANNPLTVANTRTNIAQGQNSINQSRVGNVQELRKEFNALPEVKSYSEYLTQMSKAIRAPNTPQGDLSVIYAFAKAMDPGSVVREGEMDMANSTSSLVQDIARKYGKIAEGNRLPPEVRHGLVESIRSAGHGFADSYGQRYRQYRDQAQTLGADPKQVVGNHLGDAFRPLEEKYIRDNGGKDENGPPGISFDANGNAIKQDRGRGRIDGDTGLIGEQGGFHSEKIPELAGANAALNAMLKSRAPDQSIASYLKSRGAAEDAIADIMGRVQEVRAFQKQNPGYHGDFNVDIERREMPNSGFQNFMNSDVGTGAALGANALSAGIGGALAGKQDEISVARSAHPKSAFAGETAGAIGGIYGLNKALGAAPMSAGKRLLASDVLYGSTYGATQNPEHPVKGAIIGGAAAVGGNLGGRVIAGGMRGAGDRLGYGAPPLPAGEGMIASQALKANPDDVLAKLNQAHSLGMPMTLADAAPQLRALGGSVVRKSPDAYALANQNIGARTLGQVDRLTGMIEGETGPRLNLPTFKDEVRQAAQSKSKSLYESAKGQAPVDDPHINEMLQTPAGQKAARSGYDEALNNGEPVGDLVEQADSITGQVRLVGRPSWNVLQRMKFALDGMPDQQSLARRFNGQLGKLNPDFRKANLTYAKEMRRGDIAEAGYGAANPNMKPPELGASMASPRNMKDPDLFKQGYGSNLIDKARGMRDSANPYEVASMASPDQLAKMQAVSPGLFGKFGPARGMESEMSLTNRELFGGSPTQGRAEADKMFDANGAVDALQDVAALAAGTPPINMMRSKLFAGRGTFQKLNERLQFGSANTAKQRADQMAPVMFNPNPEETSAMLAEMIRRQAERNAYVQRTGMFGSAVAAPGAIVLSGR